MKRVTEVLRILAGIALLAFAVIVGMMPSDAELEQREYCQNVKEGLWPDYERTYKVECGGENPPKFNENLIDK